MSKTWTFAGVDLSTFGNITELSDSTYSISGKRGANQVIPYRTGRQWVQKYFDQRIITLGIAVMEADETDLESQLGEMKEIFGRQTQYYLQVDAGGGVVRKALAECETGMAVNRLSNGVARVVVDLVMSEPFFRSTTVTNVNATIDASPKAMSVTNPGNVRERNAVITLTGPLSNTVISNANGVVLTYAATIASPRIVTINCGAFTAVDDLGANKIQYVQHSGDTSFMVLEIDSNSITVTDDTHTTGEVDFDFYAPYM